MYTYIHAHLYCLVLWDAILIVVMLCGWKWWQLLFCLVLISPVMLIGYINKNETLFN